MIAPASPLQGAKSLEQNERMPPTPLLRSSKGKLIVGFHY